jgi:hypothetical protein
MNNINDSKPQRQDRHGANNPMWGRTHTQQSKEKMSQAATLRNQQYRDALRNQHHITMDEFLSNNPQLDIKGYIKSLVKQEDMIKEIIRDEIKKLLS